jgi:hypothetical protein
LVELSDDPEYRATYAEVLAARRRAAALRGRSCGGSFDLLLARRQLRDHGAAFFMGIGIARSAPSTSHWPAAIRRAVCWPGAAQRGQAA